MTTLTDRLKNPKYKSWLKAGLVLKHLKTVLEDYLANDVRSLHHGILTRILQKRSRPQYVYTDIRDDIGDELKKQHKHGRLTRDNTNDSLWTHRSKSWEIGKCFMSSGYKDKHSAQDTDCAGLLALIINCKTIRNKFSPALVQPTNVFEKIRDVRNSVMHSSDLTLPSSDFNNLVQMSIRILQDPQTLFTKQAAIDAVRNIKEIHANQFLIAPEDALHVYGDSLKALAVRQYESEVELKQMLKDHKTIVEEEMKTRTDDVENKTKLQIDALRKKIEEDMDTLGSHKMQIKRVDQQLISVNDAIKDEVQTTQTIRTDMEDIRRNNERLQSLIVENQESVEEELRKVKETQTRLFEKVSSLESQQTGIAARVSGLEELEQSKSHPTEKGEHKKKVTSKDRSLLQHTLIDLYTDLVDVVPLSPLCQDEGLHIQDIFAPLLVKEDNTSKRNQDTSQAELKYVKSYNDLLCIGNDKSNVKQIFLKGSAGRGKTTYCFRMLDDWRKSKEKSKSGNGTLSSAETQMRLFDYVFFIPLRNMPGNMISIVDMICEELLHEYPQYRDTVMHVLEHSSDRCLIILDGLDEWYPSSVASLRSHGLPNRDKLNDCLTIITTRPWKLEALKFHQGTFDYVVEIQGLNDDAVDYLIEMILVKFYKIPESSDLLKQKMNDIYAKACDTNLLTHLEVPLMATFIVSLFMENEGSLKESITAIFVDLIELLIKKAEGDDENKGQMSEGEISTLKRNKTQTVGYSKLLEHCPALLKQNEGITNYISLFLSLAEIAFKSLISDNSVLVFQKSELEKIIGKLELEVCLKFGLICTSKWQGNIHSRHVSVHFFHKLMQEFLAAVWLSCEPDAYASFCRHCSSISTILDMKDVVLFVSGLNPPLVSRFSQHIVSIADTDEKILLFRQSIDDSSVTRDSTFSLNVYDQRSTIQLAHSLYEFQCKCYYESSLYTDSDFMFYVSDIVVIDGCVAVNRTSIELVKKNVTNIRSIHIVEYNHVCLIEPLYFLKDMTKIQKISIESCKGRQHFSEICAGLKQPDSVTCLNLRSNHSRLPMERVCQVCTETHFDKEMQLLPMMKALTVLHLCNIQLTAQHLVQLQDYIRSTTLLQDLQLSEINCRHGCQKRLGLDLSRNRNLEILTLHAIDVEIIHIDVTQSNLEFVSLCGVTMCRSGWKGLVEMMSEIQCSFRAIFCHTNIDIKSISMIRKSRIFTISKVEKNQYIDFTRLN